MATSGRIVGARQRERVLATPNQFPSFHEGSKRYRLARSRDFKLKKTAPQGGHAMVASPPAYDLVPLPGEGPEDVVVGSDGLIYTGLLDGRILAVAPKDG